MDTHETKRAALLLHLARGVGPILGRRLLASFETDEALLGATPSALRRVPGIGEAKSRSIADALGAARHGVREELARVEARGAHVLTLGDTRYPALLAQLPDAPLAVFCRGELGERATRFACAIVGSRRATAYGLEQAARFASSLGQAGLSIVSGGARGIDTAAHRASVDAGATTVAVLGSGLGQPYPPENRELFDRIVESGGAVVSEFPMETAPAAENFPRRNRLISGLSLGVLVIEAPTGSGALITARLANDQGREVMAVPGRVDSRSSEGANGLLQRGEAALVVAPPDVVSLLEPLARHVHDRTIGPRLAAAVGGAPEPPASASAAPSAGAIGLTDPQRALLEALGEPATLDELNRLTGLAPETLRADATILELRGLIRRHGSSLERLAGV